MTLDAHHLLPIMWLGHYSLQHSAGIKSAPSSSLKQTKSGAGRLLHHHRQGAGTPATLFRTTSRSCLNAAKSRMARRCSWYTDMSINNDDRHAAILEERLLPSSLHKLALSPPCRLQSQPSVQTSRQQEGYAICAEKPSVENC